MLNLLISCDDPMERLLYGEPDPWLALHQCRHVIYDNFVSTEPAYTWGNEVPHSHTPEEAEEYRQSGHLVRDYDGDDDDGGYEDAQPSYDSTEPERATERQIDEFLSDEGPGFGFGAETGADCQLWTRRSVPKVTVWKQVRTPAAGPKTAKTAKTAKTTIGPG